MTFGEFHSEPHFSAHTGPSTTSGAQCLVMSARQIALTLQLPTLEQEQVVIVG